MKYCIKCGRQESNGVPIIGNYCIDCYMKYRGVFKETPSFKVVLCSKCGKWRFVGKWVGPDSLENIVSKLLENYYKKFVHDEIRLVKVKKVSSAIKIMRNYYEVIMNLNVVFKNNVETNAEAIIKFSLEKTVCPQCLKKAGKTFNALVQVRSERGFLTDDEIDYVYDVVSKDNLIEFIVEISENKSGIDIKLLDPVIAKKIASIMCREKGAKITETFKLRKYDPSRGVKRGIITISVRLPDISRGDILLYRGEPGVVEKYNGDKIFVKMINGDLIKASIDDYWNGILVKPRDLVYGDTYTVVGYDNSSVYLVNDDTGELIEYPRMGSLYNLKQGDKMRGLRIGDKFYIIKVDDKVEGG